MGVLHNDRVLVLLEGEERREFFQDFVFEQARRAIDHYVRIRFRGATTRKTRSRSPSWRPLSDKHAFNVKEVIEVIRDCVAYYDERDGGTALESPVPPSVPVPGPVEDEAEQRDPVVV